MKILIDKSFEKDCNKITDKQLLSQIANVVVTVKAAKSISEIKNIKKLTGTKSTYRIRIGFYRIGIVVVDNTVIFIRCLHRKDIYKYFPKSL
jgi:mRNA interferase RelE/StbE